MPTYSLINQKTKETQTIFMSIAEYTEWKKNNPDWDTDWSKGCAKTVGQVGEFQMKTDGGWNEVLHKVSKIPGSTVKPFK